MFIGPDITLQFSSRGLLCGSYCDVTGVIKMHSEEKTSYNVEMLQYGEQYKARVSPDPLQLTKEVLQITCAD